MTDAQKPNGGVVAGGSKTQPNVINVTIIHEGPSQEEIARRVHMMLANGRRPPPGAGAAAYRNRS